MTREQKPKGAEDVLLLAEAVRNPDRKVVLAAMKKLQEIGPAAEPAIPALVERLRYKDNAIRHSAFATIGKIGPAASSVVPTLIEILADSDDDSRSSALDALGHVGEKAAGAVPAIVELLTNEDSSDRIRTYATLALGEIDTPLEVVSILVKRLSHRDDFARFAAARALAKAGPKAADAVPALVDALRDGVSVSLAAQEALGKIGAAAVPALIEALGSSNEETRHGAAGALKKIGGPAIPKLVDVIRGTDEGDEERGDEAESILSSIGVAAVPALIEIVLSDDAEQVRKAAIRALWRLGAEAVEAVPALTKALSDESHRVQYLATAALQRMEGASVPGLVAALKDKNRNTQALAAMVLGKIGEDANSAVPDLVELWDESRSAFDGKEVVKNVKAALRRIKGDSFVADTLEILNNRPPREGGLLPTPSNFAKQMFADLPEIGEGRLIALAGRLDEYREALRAELQTEVRAFIQDRNPARKEDREYSVLLISGLLDRLGFALEHPDHPGKQCYLSVVAYPSNPQGQIRLLVRGERKPLDLSAHLSHFVDLKVIDAIDKLGRPGDGSSRESAGPWSEFATKSQSPKSSKKK